jgi:ribulose-bisphosphate carboxylase large chain
MAIARAAREPWADVRPTLPVPAGGMTVERVDEMVSAYGTDTMLLISSGLLTAREKLFDKAREFVKKVAEARA